MAEGSPPPPLVEPTLTFPPPLSDQAGPSLSATQSVPLHTDLQLRAVQAAEELTQALR